MLSFPISKQVGGLMSFSPLDSQLYSASFSDPRVATIFSDVHHVRTMLEVEAALALAQGKLGVIPQAAANTIDTASRTLEPNLEWLRSGIANDGFPVIELVRQLRESLSSDAANFVHFGATTQDILDTARVLQSRAALEIMIPNLEQVMAQLARLVDLHRNTLMAGRTHTQHALPITFGFKVANWLAPLLRHLERWQEIKARVLVVQFGGAVGTLAALGNHGFEVQQALARELDLNLPLMPWHTQRDGVTELANWLALVSSSLGKMAQDVLLLVQSEIGELRETADSSRGGSSTMPQKSNPVLSELILSAARMNSGLLSSVHQTMLHEHERGTHGMQLEWLSLAQMIGLTSGALTNAVQLSESLVVNEARMLENLKASNGLMLAEALSNELAKHMPKTEAKKISAQIVQEAVQSKRHLIDVARGIVQLPLVWDDLTEANYLGSNNIFIDRVLAAAKKENP
jgi:3-carboxy-cis,cis-muconate cycloisomerase